ncbi:MAG TPA: hypothetical protein PKW33_01465 [Anaerolineaceae bacterium]|nr:hypothetical protein [Anaerolineaceae bacterium]HPN50226.1 hypothetical protein [Anaerolineaceae bacterium]
MEDERLMALFKFDESDLMANRYGRLSPKQLAAAQDLDRFGSRFAFGLGTVFGIIALIPLCIALINFLPCIQTLCEDLDLAFKIFLGVFVLIWTPIWGGLAIRIFINNSTYRQDFSVKSVEGEVNIVAVESRNTSTHSLHTHYELRIGGMTFDVTGDLANIILQGDRYVVYYLPQLNQIQSMEKI